MAFKEDDDSYLHHNANNKLTKICDEKGSSSIPGFSLGILRATFEFSNC